MMTKGVMRVIFIFITMTLLYIFQFVFAPLLFPRLFPYSNEASAMLFISNIIVSVLGMLIISPRLRIWGIADIWYLFLIFIYPAKGAYGVTPSGLALDGNTPSYNRSGLWLGLSLLFLFLIIVQVITWLFLKLIRRWK